MSTAEYGSLDTEATTTQFTALEKQSKGHSEVPRTDRRQLEGNRTGLGGVYRLRGVRRDGKCQCLATLLFYK